MSRRRKIFTIITAALLAATLAFIWGNSALSREASQSVSDGVQTGVAPFLEFFVGRGGVSVLLVRKLAHFLEFAALGVELTALFALLKKRGPQTVINCLSASLFAAVADESIQLLSGRASQVQDVLLDFSGALAGVAICLLALALLRKRRPSS